MARAGYRYLEDIATSDVAFEAWGENLKAVFVEAARALTNCMIKDLREIKRRETRLIQIFADAADILLFRFLQELIYYKDAERLLFSRFLISIHAEDGQYAISGKISGECIDAKRHKLGVDVKAVTLHQFQLSRTSRGWLTMIILDI